MRLEEVERSNVFAKVTLVITVGGIIIALSTEGDRAARLAVVVCSLIAAAGIARLWHVTSRPATFERRALLLPALALVVGAMSGVYYWGTISPITGLLVYGIYFFSLSAERGAKLLIYIVIATTHLALGVGIMAGLVEDRGIVKMTSLSTRDQLALVIIIQFLYGIAFVTAQISQKVTLAAVSRLEQAVRAVAQRDAMLAEARADLDRALEIGGPGRFTDNVVGSYKLGVLIGRGGMGEVYEAHHVTSHGEAAVKMLHAGALADPTLVERFTREATAASRIDSPHVVRVLEVGTTAGEIPFLAMERLRGHDLAYALRRSKRLPLADASAIIDQIAAGLEAARAADVVHRDLKPNNVFFSGRWTILDFGVSKVGGTGTLTMGALVGTPAYMAPEQARGEDVDHRADVYALAAILYRMVTGHPAFSAKDIPTTLHEVCYQMPAAPAALADVPQDVELVLAIGLAKSASDRFQAANELARAFAAAHEGKLPLALRRRGAELLARASWGQRI